MTMPLRLAALVLFLASATVVARAQEAAIGEWDMTTVSPVGTSTSTLVITKDGEKIVAVGKSPNGERPYDSIKVDGKDITLVITIQYDGSPMTITYVGEISKDGMGGAADFGGLAQGTWSAVAHK
jgi:hypothetical protein